MSFLSVFSNQNDTQYSVPLSDKIIRIGRAVDNDIILSSATVSSYHAIMYLRKEECYIEDLQSKNGTLVDNHRISKPTPIQDNMTVQFGTDDYIQFIPTTTPKRDLPALYCEELACFFSIAQPILLPDLQLTLSWDEEKQAALVTTAVEEEQVWIYLHQAPLLIGSYHFQLQQPLSLSRTQSTPIATWRYTPSIIEEKGQQIFVLIDDETEQMVTITQKTRVVLLQYLVSQQANQNNGWVKDSVLRKLIWGNKRFHTNSLNVLLHRIRAMVQEGGLNPCCIEKKYGHTRLVLR